MQRRKVFKNKNNNLCNFLEVEFSKKNLLQRKRIQEKKCFAKKSFSGKGIKKKKSFVNIYIYICKKGIFKKERKKIFQDKNFKKKIQKKNSKRR